LDGAGPGPGFLMDYIPQQDYGLVAGIHRTKRTLNNFMRFYGQSRWPVGSAFEAHCSARRVGVRRVDDSLWVIKHPPKGLVAAVAEEKTLSAARPFLPRYFYWSLSRPPALWTKQSGQRPRHRQPARRPGPLPDFYVSALIQDATPTLE